MKKEFSVPAIDTRDFNAPEDIMVGILFASADHNSNILFYSIDDTDSELNTSFNIWKGKNH